MVRTGMGHVERELEGEGAGTPTARGGRAKVHVPPEKRTCAGVAGHPLSRRGEPAGLQCPAPQGGQAAEEGAPVASAV